MCSRLTMTNMFSFILQKMSGTLHFLTKRHRTSTFPHSMESWVRTSPSCLKPFHPLVSSWKTWASKTSFGSNLAVSKTSPVRCEYNLSKKDHPESFSFVWTELIWRWQVFCGTPPQSLSKKEMHFSSNTTIYFFSVGKSVCAVVAIYYNTSWLSVKDCSWSW